VREGEPSRTAQGAALLRALHAEVDDPVVFRDPLAWLILGADRESTIADAQPRSRLRIFLALRQRFAEDAVAAAYARGTRQVVVLGAGLDTFAYRNPHPDLTVFEVDHPATLAWKRGRVEAAGIEVPPTVAYVGLDFERDDLMTGLERDGFDAARPAIFVWLGVVPYLTHDAVVATLRAVGSVPSGEVVFDWAGTDRTVERSTSLVRLTELVADVGEPFAEPWEPEELDDLLTSCGFTEVEELLLRAGSGAHVVRARRR
jgi:methyltransferase (TIGR00027 family)